ncbi:uncharacterized protein LOC108675521 [Hyalella azteca]|uniref:Uncharacterized protein LOC108675521 n=1 Tax=Hyalella azteca TaxID=294128 RepID=A0A8B7P1T4_HYAAZ|nr:uncharacterized protein LOC108675521 [Hyalella azteca]
MCVSVILFKFISVAHDSCITTSNTQGICYSATDCTNLQGTASGTCAAGLGVCCTFTRNCESSTNINGTLFQNPEYPSVTTAALAACRLKVSPVNNNICQIRLDLTDFSIGQPNAEGVCVTDFLQVTGGATNIPLICGENAGQHLYLDVSPDFGSITINVDTSTVGAKWNISVTQISCNSPYRAPSGCLQYFTSTFGTIKSFNYDAKTTSTTTAPTATTQLANQEYGACIKSQTGFCSVVYSKTSGVSADYSFSMTDDPGSYAPGTVIPGMVKSSNCSTDYLVIPSGIIADTNLIYSNITAADRYCGANFAASPDTIASKVQPFVLYVVTDGTEVGIDGYNVGFSIDYRMQAC